MSVVSEIDSIITILENAIPANPNSLKNREKRRRLQRDIAKLFNNMEKAFPYQKLSAIYNRYVKESLGSDTDDILNPLIKAFGSGELTMVEGHLTGFYVDATAEMVSWGKTKGGVPITYEGPPLSQAVDWAEKRGAWLVKGMDEETKKRLAHTISQGIETKRGVPGLARDIRSTFADMSKHRSELIARTETANALSQASLDTMEDMGIDGKEWITAGDDRVSEECEGNENEGVIPVGQTFSGGVMAPPQHPDCRCVIAPSRLIKRGD